MNIALGQLFDELGLARSYQPVATPHDRQRSFDVKLRHWASPADEVRAVQPEKIKVNMAHGSTTVGEVVHLERAGRHLWAVLELPGDEVDPARLPELYLSAETDSEQRGAQLVDTRVSAVGLVEKTAQLGTHPIKVFPGRLDSTYDRGRWKLSDFERKIVENAAADTARRRRDGGGPIIVRGTQATPRLEHLSRPSGQLLLRSAAQVDVHPARRELDLLIVPAEIPTTIFERGRSYTEVFSHGAFAGVERTPQRIKVNRDHVRSRVIGRATKLNPFDEAGLTGTIKLARVSDADEALALVDDGLLGVSAGFAVDTEEWHGRSHKRVRRAMLDHVALVVDAAYPSAAVTAVRSHVLA